MEKSQLEGGVILFGSKPQPIDLSLDRDPTASRFPVIFTLGEVF